MKRRQENQRQSIKKEKLIEKEKKQHKMLNLRNERKRKDTYYYRIK